MKKQKDTSWHDILEKLTDHDENEEIDTSHIKNFFDKYNLNHDIEVFEDDCNDGIENKVAYPNHSGVDTYLAQRDITKWLNAAKQLYIDEKNGLSSTASFNNITNNWTDSEKIDFKRWINYYQSKTHLKYKKAALYDTGTPGYYIPFKHNDVAENLPITVDKLHENVQQTMTNQEKQLIIEKQKQKLISRLDSAEKLLRSKDGQIFAGKELESLIESIYSLKKKIQLINKVSNNTKIYEDFFIRESNILTNKGFVKAASHMISLAQEALPAPESPPMPTDGSQIPGSIPSEMLVPGNSPVPGEGSSPPLDFGDNAPTEDSKEKPSEAIKEFLSNLKTNNITTDDDLEADDFVVNAQLQPSVAPPIPTPVVQSESAPEDVVVDEKPETPVDIEKAPRSDVEISDSTKSSDKDIDNLINSAFSTITVADIITKLEDIAQILSTREIPRQLSLVDLMLDKKNLVSLFPQLSEAMNKSIEANNYMASRIDDVLSKLKGTIDSNSIDLKNSNRGKATDPESEKIREMLQSKNDKEKQMKDMRKQMQDQEFENSLNEKEEPEVSIDEDLQPQAPAPTQQIPQQPVAPVK